MLTIIWLLFLALIFACCASWLYDNNGLVLIQWFGYEVRTDILTAIISAVSIVVMTLLLTHVLTRILSISIPSLLGGFFKKRRLRKLEKILSKQNEAFNLLAEMLLAIGVKKADSFAKFFKKFDKLVDNSRLDNVLQAKLNLHNGNFAEAEKFLKKIEPNPCSELLLLNVKFELALQNKDENLAISCAKKIISENRDLKIAKKLLELYKKQGMWQEAQSLLTEFKDDQLRNDLGKRDLAIISTENAEKFYRQKNFGKAIRSAKMALAEEENFLPAIEILLKSWIKSGLSFKASWKIKALWRQHPQLVLAEIFDFIHRKNSPESRIKAMKKLARSNEESVVGKLAVGQVCFKVGRYEDARHYLVLALEQEKSHRIYSILSSADKALGHLESSKRNLVKAKELNRKEYYCCNACGYSTFRWRASCPRCQKYDSLYW
jgi:HemY protein